MKKMEIMMVAFVCAISLFSTAALAKTASVILREGLYAEEIEGDIDTAIDIYEQIIQDSSASRPYVAQALYRQGMCYLKKKNEHNARMIFGKLVAKYNDQTEIVEKVKPLLNELMYYDPADLMPPETLVYIEVGSPGKQIETILNMLKGTPFENPLEAIGKEAPAGQGDKSPEDILAALLNPSMMAEFRKIRGMAIGITAIKEENPPGVTVLYPGKSDALKGIILAALGIAGQKGEPIETMETIHIKNGPSVAYDDRVIIIAQPPKQLKWCVRQYKGINSEPTLASSNKSFAKVGKQRRQDNALTIWANVDKAYTGVLKQFPAGQIPGEILQADAFVDFNSIDDLIMYISLEESGLTCKADVSFKSGHRCLAYDMIRTPNLSRAAFEVVPSDAIAIASFALGEADEIQVKAINKKIRNVTGFDIGREIFANIEHVTLFAVPSGKAPGDNHPILPDMGLAITSQNPQRTRQTLTVLLETASLMSGAKKVDEADVSSGKYQIGKVGDQGFYCYMDQVDKTTVLSLNKNITDACISAVKQGKSACTAGPLKDSINKLSPTTSKLLLANVGGTIRVIAPATIANFGDSDRGKIQQALEQLAQSCSKTTIELSTDEQLNNFVLNTFITGLPPLNEVFGPVTEISGIVKQARAKAELERRRAQTPVVIAKTAKAPVIDGKAEDIWSIASEYKIENVMYSPPSSPNDLSAGFKAMWDENNLYVLIEVTDDNLKNDSSPDQWWFDDCIEVYIDADNSKSNQYDSNDAQYHFDWDKTNPTMGVHQQHGRTENVEFVMVTTQKGYRTEIKFPWSTLGAKPSTGVSIGFDVHVNDDDDGGQRDGKIGWNDKDDRAWDNPQVFGNAVLAGMVGWWKFDETEGGIAKDSSSGNHEGTLHGDAKWAKGKIGGAIELDGSGDFVKIADESAFDITGQVTIACWVNIHSLANEWMSIVTKGDNSWRLSTELNKRIFHASVNDWQKFRISGKTEVTANEWHHVAAVYDGQQMCIYVDGKVDVCQPWTGGIGKNDYDVLIGENAQEKNRYFDGLIDDVRIYNYALREADITALYNEGLKR